MERRRLAGWSPVALSGERTGVQSRVCRASRTARSLLLLPRARRTPNTGTSPMWSCKAPWAAQGGCARQEQRNGHGGESGEEDGLTLLDMGRTEGCLLAKLLLVFLPYVCSRKSW